eukprot:GHVL01007914.1.p1 GENE.GHVL01007914.1~~GHVL01007914.1.p1  ORF type:complete len:318 (+),score=71.09 GHVL01007914.1:807-1760(+)
MQFFFFLYPLCIILKRPKTVTYLSQLNPIEKYPFKDIEHELKNFNYTSAHENNKKYYILGMFPHPTGSGLHIGHIVGYCVTDVIARFKRMMGYNVMHPMGWDTFGLPCELEAKKQKITPHKLILKNCKIFKNQLKRLGMSYDWSREITTSDKKYYKWTQWMISKMWEKGLLYTTRTLVNWCPELNTVLANEEVVNGQASSRGGFAIKKRLMTQWMLRLSDYAEYLDNGLDNLDWPKGLKNSQRKWLGRRDGFMIKMAVSSPKNNETAEFMNVFVEDPKSLTDIQLVVLAQPEKLLKINSIKNSILTELPHWLKNLIQ